MHLRCIEIRNFLSIGEASFSFDAGIHLVQGINFDMSVDGTESNGSGKSAVTGEAIEWCLWGTLSRVKRPISDDVINSVSGADCLVKLTFSVGDKTWTVLRTRKHSEFGDCLRWWIDDVEMTKHLSEETKKDLEKRLPISHVVFRHAVQAGQGLPDRFLALSETDKQNCLSEILGLNIYDDALSAAVNTVTVLETELSAEERVLATLESTLLRVNESLNQALTDLRVANEGRDKFNKDFIELTSKSDQVKAEVSSWEEALKDLQTSQSVKNAEYQAWSNSVSSRRVEASKKISDAEDLSRKSLAEWESGRSKVEDAVTRFSMDVNTKNGIVSHIRAQINELSRVGTKCPTCGQDLQNKDGVGSRINALLLEERVALDNLESARRTLSDNIQVRTDFDKQYGEVKEKWKNYIDSVRLSVQSTLSEIDAESAKFSRDITNLGEAISSTNNTVRHSRSSLSAVERQIEAIQGRLRTVELEAVRADERCKVFEKDRDTTVSSLDRSKEKADQVRRKLAIWAYWKESIPNLRAAAMEEILTYLNGRIEEYMSEFSSGIMGMEMYQVPYGKKSKIKVNLRTAGGTYEMSSGGERRRIDLAIYLALSDLLYAASGVQCNVLVADEVMDGLSPEGVRKFSQVLRKKANNGMCVFVISHNPTVQQMIEYDSIMTVEKRGNIANLTVNVPNAA